VLRFTSCQAEVAESFCKTLAIFVGQRLGIPREFVGEIPWQERERLLDRGDIHVSWICGLPYVRKGGYEKAPVELLAAPVMKHARYCARPVYYSDVIVRADSPFLSFADLRGAVWAYNEPRSHSGYNVVRYHLAAKGMPAAYFGRVVESGSHHNSLQMILQRSIDAAAIDSTVLEMELVRDPRIAAKIRTVMVLGPSPAPPWVVHRSIPDTIRQAVRREFLSMDKDRKGVRILEAAGFRRFVRVSDHNYDPIRKMDQIAEGVEW